MTFADLGLSPDLLKAVDAAGYTEPTPIQAQAIPPVLMMKDIIGIAQTGTGKTASFVLPMIDVLASGRRRALMPRSLILEPTRELAAQVAENFEKYGVNHDLKMALLIGGVQMGDQIKALNEGVDVLIATPGRLMDLFERGKILLNGCELLVIDEADRMLDMGFIPDIEFICAKLPEQRQTMLFSATMPPPIEKLAKTFLSNPKRIEVSRAASTNENITAFKVNVAPRQKRESLRWMLRNDLVETAIIFANRKTTVRELNQSLQRHGFASCEIHGDMDQTSRLKELDRFKAGDVNIMVASDVAARGLDIKGVSHVFNYDAPWHPDDYVHRIGRTGRAGAKGRAFTFYSKADAEAIENIEKLTGSEIPVFGKADVRVELKAEPEPDGKSKASKVGSEKSGAKESSGEKSSKSRAHDEGDDNRDQRAGKKRSGGRSKSGDDTARGDGARRDRSSGSRGRRSDKASGQQDQSAAAPAANSSEGGHDESAPGDWNGPQPGFLDVKLG